MKTDELNLGTRFDDRYAILARIGGGSFGVVYSAFDHIAGREVALKILREEAQQDPTIVQRFEREAEICAQLSNPHTAKLHGFGKAPATDAYPEMPYMVFDFVRGISLGLLVSFRHRLSVEETAHVLIQTLESLEEAHQLGIIHRDVKPDNVLCVPPAGSFRAPEAAGTLHQILGVPPMSDPVWGDLSQAWIRVVDFGLGKMLDVGGRRVKPLTRAGMAAGTATYMSPEQLQAKPIDHRSDLYSVAMMLHRLLVGKETYGGGTVPEVAMAHISRPLPELPEPWNAHPIADVFRRAAAKDPDERYASAAEMAHALRCILDPEIAAEPAPVFEPPPTPGEPGLAGRVMRFLKRS